MSFGRKFKECRLKLDLSIDEVAEKSNISKKLLSRYEKDSCTPNIDDLRSIAKVLGVYGNDLIPISDIEQKVLKGTFVATVTEEDRKIYESENSSQIGRNLFSIIRSRGTSLDYIAKCLGLDIMDQDTIPAWIHNDSKPTLDMLQMIAGVLGVEVSEILAPYVPDENNTLGMGLVAYRQEAGLSPAQLAWLCKLSDLELRNYELGRQIPTDEILKRISDVLNVSADKLTHRFEENSIKGTSSHEKMAIAVGERVKKLRLSKNLIREDLSDMSGVDVACIKNCELGVGLPRKEILLKLAYALDVELSDLTDNISEAPVTDTSDSNKMLTLQESASIFTDVWGQLNASGRTELVKRALELVEDSKYTDED